MSLESAVVARALLLVFKFKIEVVSALFLLAKLRLVNLGVDQIYGGEECTYSNPSRFYSYRRDNRTGRMAALIWLSATDTAT